MAYRSRRAPARRVSRARKAPARARSRSTGNRSGRSTARRSSRRTAGPREIRIVVQQAPIQPVPGTVQMTANPAPKMAKF